MLLKESHHQESETIINLHALKSEQTMLEWMRKIELHW